MTSNFNDPPPIISLSTAIYADNLTGFDDALQYLAYGDNFGNYGLGNGDVLIGDIAGYYSSITLGISQSSTSINFGINPGAQTAFMQQTTIGGNPGSVLTLGDTFNNSAGVGGINFGSGDSAGINNQIYSDPFDILNIASTNASVFFLTPNGNVSFMDSAGVVIGPNPYSPYGIQIGGGSGYQSGGGVIDIAPLSGVAITAAGEVDVGNGGFTDPSPGAGYDLKCGGTQGGITAVGAINSNAGYLLNDSMIIDQTGNATFPGTIETTSGVTWDLGAVTSTIGAALIATSYLAATINGTPVKIALVT